MIGKEVKRHRERLDLRQDQLAERCTAAGLPISRSKLANLERGHARQEGVSVAEVLILADALGVPPVSLIFPVDGARTADAEVLPAVEVSQWDAVQWFTGEGLPPRMEVIDPQEPEFVTWERQAYALSLYRRHEALVRDWRQNPGYVLADSDEERERLFSERLRRRDDIRSRLTEVRSTMRALGLRAPSVPRDLAPTEEAGSE